MFVWVTNYKCVTQSGKLKAMGWRWDNDSQCIYIYIYISIIYMYIYIFIHTHIFDADVFAPALSRVCFVCLLAPAEGTAIHG